MMMRGHASTTLALSLIFLFPVSAFAQSVTDTGGGPLKQDIDQINAQVKEKEQQIQQVDGLIGKYKSKIAEHESAVASLQNETVILENRAQEKQLAVERTKNEIDLAGLQLQSLSQQITLDGQELARRRAILGELVRQVQEADDITPFHVLITRPSLSEFFARLEEVKQLESDLGDATKRLHDSQTALLDQHKATEAEQLTLEGQKQQLEQQQRDLDAERAAKTSLIAETQNSETEFQRMLYELRAEQQSSADTVAALQDKLKEKLDSIDQSLARGDVLLDWPIKVLHGISAFFHDPNYPFRYLFEHPGIDIPTDVGTPVRAAAGGYVAWTRTGKQYGNYIMLVHPGGIATIYAHLSRFGVQPDTYVERGDVIGYSGGHPGDEGAGLSTGSHLHFEVRQNGIPTNPLNFLPSL